MFHRSRYIEKGDRNLSCAPTPFSSRFPFIISASSPAFNKHSRFIDAYTDLGLTVLDTRHVAAFNWRQRIFKRQDDSQLRQQQCRQAARRKLGTKRTSYRMPLVSFHERRDTSARLQVGISFAELAFSVLCRRGKMRLNEDDWKSFQAGNKAASLRMAAETANDGFRTGWKNDPVSRAFDLRVKAKALRGLATIRREITF